jgi:putative peptide zinc metalloprotease protein
MIEVTQSYIPELADALSITPFDSSTYLICVDSEKKSKLKISSASKILIDQIDGRKDIEEITHSFNQLSGSALSTESVIQIFRNQLLGYGVLKDDDDRKIRIKDNYLKLRFTLFKEKTVQRMAAPFLFLFHQKTFAAVFALSTAFIITVFCTQLNLSRLYHDFSASFAGWFILLNVISIIFHELGHAAACEKFGARSGDIGFGFYLITPVFYADVSDAWRLSRHRRLVVDLAGIYMQVIYCSIFAGVYLLTGTGFFLHISFLIASTTLLNVNPFLRYDGYWALSDLINIPNLRGNSLKTTRQFFRSVVGKPNTWKRGAKNIFLVFYAVISVAFIVYFMFAMVIMGHNSIIGLPVNLYNFIYRLFTEWNQVSFDWVKRTLAGFILPLMFYIIFYRVVLTRYIIPFFAKKSKL